MHHITSSTIQASDAIDPPNLRRHQGMWEPKNDKICNFLTSFRTGSLFFTDVDARLMGGGDLLSVGEDFKTLLYLRPVIQCKWKHCDNLSTRCHCRLPLRSDSVRSGVKANELADGAVDCEIYREHLELRLS